MSKSVELSPSRRCLWPREETEAMDSSPSQEFSLEGVSSFRSSGAQHSRGTTDKTTHQSTFYGSLWDTLSSTLHGCKVGMSYLYSNVHFSMMGQAFIQQNPDNSSFGLAVVCYRSDKRPPDLSRACGSTRQVQEAVGGTLRPKMVRSGAITVRLVSCEFEADTQHGEHANLCKTEADFRGREFEMQFACRFKGSRVREGVFGKVLVQRMGEDKRPETVFEFNLAKGLHGRGRKPLPPVLDSQLADSGDSWSLLAVKELAARLRLTEEDRWRAFARQLGFTDYEMTKLALSREPFQAVVISYQARGGSPEEFVQALYEISLKLRMSGDISSNDTNVPSLTPQSSFGSSNQEDEDDVFDTAPGATQPVALPSSSGGPCLTPPLTPRKRKSTSECCSSPFKRNRRPSMGDESVFLFPDQEEDEETRCRECRVSLPPGVLWQVSAHVHHRWKSLGRTLDIPETELLCIEHAANKDLRECAYQALLKWQDIYPHRNYYGALYTALCSCGLNSVAHKHCTISDYSMDSA